MPGNGGIPDLRTVVVGDISPLSPQNYCVCQAPSSSRAHGTRPTCNLTPSQSPPITFLFHTTSVKHQEVLCFHLVPLHNLSAILRPSSSLSAHLPGSSHPAVCSSDPLHDFTADGARCAWNIVFWMAVVCVPEFFKVRSLPVELLPIRRPTARLPALLQLQPRSLSMCTVCYMQ